MPVDYHRFRYLRLLSDKLLVEKDLRVVVAGFFLNGLKVVQQEALANPGLARYDHHAGKALLRP